MAGLPSFTVGVNTTGLRALVVTLQTAGVRAGVRLHQVSAHHAALLEASVKRHASGRPGPNAPTGDYRRSIKGQVRLRGGEVEVLAFSDKPQARRLEWGFTGTDAIGRVYDQPPFPHFFPAGQEVAPGYIKDVGLIGVDVLEGK